MNILFFGDSNTHIYCDGNFTLEKHAGLFMKEDMFDFYFNIALEDDYDLVVCCIGHNDWGTGSAKHELQSGYKKIKQMHKNIIIIGPYGDIDTRGLETSDGIHFTDKSKQIIKENIKEKIDSLLVS